MDDELQSQFDGIWKKKFGVSEEGNIDLNNRPIVKNPDGSISTVLSKSFNIDGKETLLPTIRQGLDRPMTDEEALGHYKNTGEHLGKFNSIKDANKYAQILHESQGEKYQDQQPDLTNQFDAVANQSLPYRKLVNPEKYNTQAYKAADKLTDYPYNKVLSMAAAGGVPADQREEFLQAIHEYAGHKKTSQGMGAPQAMAVGMFNAAAGLGEFFAEQTGIAQEPEDMRKFEKHVDAAWSKADPLVNPNAPWYSPRKIGTEAAQAAPQMEAAIGAGPMIAFGGPAAGKTYDDLLEKGVAPDTAKAAAALSGVIQGAIFSGLPGKMLPKGLTPELAGQEIAENFVARYAKTALVHGPSVMAGAQAVDEVVQDFAQGKTPEVQQIIKNAANTYIKSIPTMAALALPGAAAEGISRIGQPKPELTDTQKAITEAADRGVKPSRVQARDWGLELEGKNNAENRTAALQKAAAQYKAQQSAEIPVPQKAPQETTTVPDEKAEDVSKSLDVHKDLTDTIKAQALNLKSPTGEKSEVISSAEGDRPEVKGEYLGDVNGKKVIAVNAIDVNRSLVDKKGAEDFISGGNKPWWDELFKNGKGPKENELWVADYVPPEELPKWAAHEAFEEHLMRTKGMDYESAHKEANKLEWGWADKGEGDVRNAPPVAAAAAVKYEQMSRAGSKKLPSVEDYLASPTVHTRGKNALRELLKSPNQKQSAIEFVDNIVNNKKTSDKYALSALNIMRSGDDPWDKVDRINDVTELSSILSGTDLRKIRKGYIGAKGFMKSEEAAVPIEPIAEKLVEVRNKVGNAMRMADSTKALSIAKDYSENLPVIEARKVRNEIEHEAARQLGYKKLKITDADANAIPFLVEAGGDPTRLAEFKTKIYTTKGNEKAKAAIQYVIDHQKQLEPLRDRIQHLLEERQYTEKEKGFDVDFRKNYFPHEQEVKPELSLLFPEKGYGGKSFTHQRVYDSFADSIAAGVKPRTLNGLDLLEARFRKGIRMETQKEFSEAGRHITDPTTKMPLITDLQIKTKKNEEGKEVVSDVVAPPGYIMKHIGESQVAVHEGYASLYDALTGGSAIRNTAAGRVALTGVGGIKHGLLLFDTYHLGRIAFWRTTIHPTATLTGEGSYKKGIMLLDNSDAELQRMAYNNEIPKEYLPQLLENRSKLDTLIKNGLNVGRIADNIAPNFLRTIPILKETAGKYNTWLFEQFQRGGITQSALLEFDRTKSMMPELSDEQVAQRVAGDLNTRFGSLGSQGWIKSKTLSDISRLIFLAPQWNEGLIKSEYKAALGLGETARYAASGRLVANTITKSVVAGIAGTFAANQLINFITRGKPTWENEEEGFGAKISAYIPNPFGKGGVFLNPLALPAELTHQVISRMGKDGTLLQAAADVAGYKTGPLPRSVLAGLDSLKKGGTDWEAIKASGTAMIPLPIPTKAAAAGIKSLAGGKVTENYPGQIEKQVLMSAGIRTDVAPLPEQRIYALADKFRNSYASKTGVKLPPKPPSEAGDYTELTNALRQGDTERAEKAMKELVKIKETPAIYKHFRQYPHEDFLQSKKLEYQFKQTLNKEQLGTYDKAKAGRMEISNKFREQYTPEKINKLREEK